MLNNLSELFQFFIGKVFVVPLWEFIVYVMVASVCLLFGRHRAGLLITYCGIFYWMFILNYQTFLEMLAETAYGFIIYVLAACLMIVMFVVGFFTGHKKN